jgi:hypothetical protein
VTAVLAILTEFYTKSRKPSADIFQSERFRSRLSVIQTCFKRCSNGSEIDFEFVDILNIIDSLASPVDSYAKGSLNCCYIRTKRGNYFYCLNPLYLFIFDPPPKK